MKYLWGGDSVVKEKKNNNDGFSFSAAKFLTCMLSQILRRIFLCLGKKILWSFWDHLLVSITILKKNSVLGTLKMIKNIDFLTRILQPLCVRIGPGADAYSEHTSKEQMHTLSNEYTSQELMRAVSIRVRNWCIPWVYVCLKRSRQNMLNSKQTYA